MCNTWQLRLQKCRSGILGSGSSEQSVEMAQGDLDDNGTTVGTGKRFPSFQQPLNESPHFFLVQAVPGPD